MNIPMYVIEDTRMEAANEYVYSLAYEKSRTFLGEVKSSKAGKQGICWHTFRRTVVISIEDICVGA